MWFKNKYIIILFLFQLSFGQTNPEDIETANNELEENFYEALKQKAIEDHDKAITLLEKCIVKDNKIPEVYYQLGTNYLALKNFIDAEKNFQKATDLNPKQRWYLNGLYDVYYATKDYKKSIETVQKLIVFDANMKEDLASLYMNTQQFEKAKATIDDIESKGPLSKTMELYKLQIANMFKNSKPELENLLNAISTNPNVEQNYIDLISYYAENKQEDKAFETAKKLAVVLPNSDWAQVSLVKFYINDNKTDEATKAFKTVIKSEKIDDKIKHRVLNEYLIYATKNTQLLPEIDAVLPNFSQDKMNAYKEIGKYFYNKNNYKLAQNYLETGLSKKAEDMELLDLLLNVYDFNNEFEKMAKQATNYTDLYPTKANLYYYAGKGYNQLKQYKKAKTYLELGEDFASTDKKLATSLYKQLLLCADGLQDLKLKQNTQKKLDLISK
jgi:lipopolysaccharide biosynthesis regulator YciM